MIFWAFAGLLTAVAVGLLLLPLLRRTGETLPRQAYDLNVYRDQLGEVERDLDRGVLTEDQAAAARTEIERRLLGAAERQPETAREVRGKGPSSRRAGLLAAGLALGLPAGAFSLYLLIGAPGVPSIPLAERATTADDPTDMATLVERLARRLAANPEDPQGWRLLARSYGQLGRFDEAAAAFRQAIARGGEDAETWASLGEMLTAATGGLVTPEARQAFATALRHNPDDPRARYYGGLAFAQDERFQDALGVWQSLQADSPLDAPWRNLLEQQIARTQAALGIEGGGAPTPAPAPGPTAEDRAAAADMTADERAAFIRSMVDRLATRLENEPDDLDGWLRLTRAYTVLGERDKATEALDRATELAAKLPADAPERKAIESARAALARDG